MHSAASTTFQLGVVKDEFSEAFARAAASKRAADPKAALTAVEGEALGYFEQAVVDFRCELENGMVGLEPPSRRFAPVDIMDLTRAIRLIRGLRAQTLSSADAEQLTKLLAKLDLRRRRRARHHETAAFSRELGF